jgi:hypothetical protein
MQTALDFQGSNLRLQIQTEKMLTFGAMRNKKHYSTRAQQKLTEIKCSINKENHENNP